MARKTAIDFDESFLRAWKNLAKATIDDLRQVDGVGEIVAESVVAWFADEDNVKLLNKFTELGVVPRFNKKGWRVEWKKFCRHGYSEIYGTRHCCG